MGSFGIVEDKEVNEFFCEAGQIVDEVEVIVDELFLESSVKAFNTAIDLWAAWVGITLQLIEVCKRKIDANKILFLLLTCIFWIGVLRYALFRGTDLYDRFLLFAFITVLPFSVLPLTYYYKRRKHRSIVIALVTLTLIASVSFKPRAYKSRKNYHNNLFVTLWEPTEGMPDQSAVIKCRNFMKITTRNKSNLRDGKAFITATNLVFLLRLNDDTFGMKHICLIKFSYPPKRHPSRVHI